MESIDLFAPIYYGMSPLEIFGVIFTAAAVWLTVKRNVWGWPIGMVGVFAYFFIFYKSQLYADAGLQIVFFLQGAYGWYFWLNGKKEDLENVPIRRLTLKEQGLVLGILVAMILIVGYLSDVYTDTDVAYLDAMVASISLVANLLLARKIIDNWPMWIFVDIIYVGLFIYKELYLTAGLYAVFVCMATAGLIQWRKEWLAQISKKSY